MEQYVVTVGCEYGCGGSGLVTADAMARAFNSSIMSKVVLIVGGM